MKMLSLLGQGSKNKGVVVFIEEIVIEKEGELAQRIKFKQGLSVTESSTELYDIIKLILGTSEPRITFYNVRFSAKVLLDETYYFCGKKDKGEALFDFVVLSENKKDCAKEYFYNIKQNQELDSSLFFDEFKKQNYPNRLLHYNDLFKYYPNGDFAILTNGYGTTRSFKGFMAQYIKYFKPIKLREDKEWFLRLLPSGKFQVESTNISDKVNLSEVENVLYHYYSFINIADFWDRADRIRNIFSVKKPLIVSSFLERMDESVDISEILRKTNSLDRQTIIFVPKMVHQLEYNVYKG